MYFQWPVSRQVKETKGCFNWFYKYSPNSRCRPCSCLLDFLAMYFVACVQTPPPSLFYFLLAKRVKCSAILYLLPKQPNPVPKSSRLAVQFSLTSFFTLSNFFQIWSTVAGYDIVRGLLSNQKRRAI